MTDQQKYLQAQALHLLMFYVFSMQAAGVLDGFATFDQMLEQIKKDLPRVEKLISSNTMMNI